MASVTAVPAPDATAASPVVAGKKRTSMTRRTRRQCSQDGCIKVDAGGGFCVGHGGGKKCSFPGCEKGYQTGGFCRRHGGGARCQVAGCGKVDAGRGLCRRHGGGKRCQSPNCPKADVGGGFCTAHGGGKRCTEPGCTKIDQGGGKCRAHGGAKRCRRRSCQQPARGSTGFCTEHGGARVCSAFSCRRLARTTEGGTLCATCAKSASRSEQQETTAKAEAPADARLSPNANVDPDETPAQSPRTKLSSDLTSRDTSPSSAVAMNARCDGSQMANCLENGCSRSFGGDCNCARHRCTCTSPTSASNSGVAVPAPGVTSSTTEACSDSSNFAGTSSSSGFATSSLAFSESASDVMAMRRFVLQVKMNDGALGIEAVVALLKSRPSVRSVHVVSGGSRAAMEFSTLQKSTLRFLQSPSPSSYLLALRGEADLELESVLAPVRSLELARFQVVEQATASWSRKEVVLRAPEMMCPGNCGSSVLNAVQAVEGVEAAMLRFGQRQVVVRGDMSANALCSAVEAIGFDATVDSQTPLPRRFRFRVDGLIDLGLTGRKLKAALRQEEGVESVVVLTDRAEVLVVALLSDTLSLVTAARRVGFEMLELSEEAWGIPMEVMPAYGTTNHTQSSSADDNSSKRPHQCDMRVCPENGCPRYMTTVAHTAALAIGWAVPGCGMASGGECTCGDNCKCEGCPEHNPVS